MAVGTRHPAVTGRIARRAIGEGTADDDRRVGFLRRLGPGHRQGEIDELTVIFRLCFRPAGFHGLDPLTRQLVAGGEDRAVVRHFLDVPAVADAEQEAAGGNLIDRGDQFRRLDQLALGDQADAGAELKPLCFTAAAAVSTTNGSMMS